MIKLNKNIYVGLQVEIPGNLSWQTAHANIGGRYVVTEIEDSDFWYGIVVLSRLSDGVKIESTPANIAYLTGTSVANKGQLEAIDPNEFQPESSDYFRNDYLTEENEDFGFWYCGSRGNRRTVDSTMIPCLWCYAKMPW